MGKKKAFLIYYDNDVIVYRLTDDEAGQLFKSLFPYVKEHIIPDFEYSPALAMAFDVFRMALDRDTEKYEQVCNERAKAGRLGGLAKAKNAKQNKQLLSLLSKDSKDKQSLANLADIDTDTENDSDSDIDTDTETNPSDSDSGPDSDKYTLEEIKKCVKDGKASQSDGTASHCYGETEKETEIQKEIETEKKGLVSDSVSVNHKLVTFEDLKEIAREYNVQISDAGIRALCKQIESEGGKLYGRPIDNPLRALRGFAKRHKENTTAAKAEQAADPRPKQTSRSNFNFDQRDDQYFKRVSDLLGG